MAEAAGGARPGRSRDWLRVLDLGPEATTAEITAAIERLSRQANALSLTAPDRARLIRDQIRAIKQDLLAGGEPSAASHDGPGQVPGPSAQSAGHPPAPLAGGRAGGLMSRLTQFLQAGWACPHCGYGALPTDKFCPKCGSKIQPAAVGSGAGPRDAGTPAAASADCPRCGRPLAPENAFCIWCGTPRI